MNTIVDQHDFAILNEISSCAHELGWLGQGSEAGTDDVHGALSALGLDSLRHRLLVLSFLDLSCSPQVRRLGPLKALAAFAAGNVDNHLLEPYFNKAVYERRRGETFASLRDALADFLDVGYRERISPTALFNERAYVARYPDVRGFPKWLLVHYLRHGSREGRSPGFIPDPGWFSFFYPDPAVPFAKRWIDPTTDTLRPLSQAHKTSQALGNLPNDPMAVLSVIGSLEDFAEAHNLSSTQASLVFELLDVSLLAAQCGAATEDGASVVADWAAGGHPNARPSRLFDASFYAQSTGKTFANILEAFLDFVCHGSEARISPTPLFDEAFYLWRYRDLRSVNKWAFWHFLRHGVVEGRQASALFDGGHYTYLYGPLKRPALLDYLERAEAGEMVRPAVGWPTLSGLELGSGPSVDLSELATHLAAKKVFDYSQGGLLRRLITEAGALEPQVKFYDERRVHWIGPFNAPHLQELQQMRRRLGRADILILRDQITFGGADIVGMHLSNALRKLYPQARIVVASTLGAPFEGSLELYDAVEHVDLSDLFLSCPEELRHRLMYDALMGTGCQAVVVLNSLFGWEALKKLGRQISQAMLVYGYLFCDDRDPNGEVEGYPARYFLDCMPWLERVFLDSKYLYDQLAARMLNSLVYRRKTSILPTPSLNLPGDLAERWQKRDVSRYHRPRIAWAGRFDRQKRVDLLLDIAKGMPETDFLVLGQGGA